MAGLTTVRHKAGTRRNQIPGSWELTTFRSWQLACNSTDHEDASLEVDPARLPERIQAARCAILDRIEERFPKKSDNEEQVELRVLSKP